METPPPEHVKHNKTPRAGPRVTFASPKAKDLLTHSPHMMAVRESIADKSMTWLSARGSVGYLLVALGNNRFCSYFSYNIEYRSF